MAIRGKPAHEGQPGKAGATATAASSPQLPDATGKIRQDIMDYGTRYRAKITIENEGTAPMPEVTVVTLIIPNYHTGTPPTPEQCISDPQAPCERHKKTVGPLAPGQKKSYHAGKKRLRTTTILVHVSILCGVPGAPAPPECAESDTGNNTFKRVLGPH